jgi:hypothetical protein
MDDDEGALGAPGDGARRRTSKKPPHPAHPRIESGAESPSPSEGEGLGSELSDYQGGCNRRVQVTKRGWNRFDRARKKIFLKWFAATANAKGSARRAGVGYSTVYDHRMADARFAEAWDRALEQSYARLEAKVVQMQFDEAAAKPIDFDGAFEPPDPPVLDLPMAMQLLKQHKTEVMRIREERALRSARDGRRRKTLGYERERIASDAEVRRALVKSLQAFGVRVTKDDLKDGVQDPSTIASSRNGSPPLPSAGEE